MTVNRKRLRRRTRGLLRLPIQTLFSRRQPVPVSESKLLRTANVKATTKPARVSESNVPRHNPLLPNPVPESKPKGKPHTRPVAKVDDAKKPSRSSPAPSPSISSLHDGESNEMSKESSRTTGSDTLRLQPVPKPKSKPRPAAKVDDSKKPSKPTASEDSCCSEFESEEAYQRRVPSPPHGVPEAPKKQTQVKQRVGPRLRAAPKPEPPPRQREPLAEPWPIIKRKMKRHSEVDSSSDSQSSSDSEDSEDDDSEEEQDGMDLDSSTSTTISKKRKHDDFDDSEAQKELAKALGKAANAFGELLFGVIKDAVERGVRDGFREARREEREEKRMKK